MQATPQIKVVAPVNQGQFLATATPVQPYANAASLVQRVNNLPSVHFVNGVTRDMTYDQISQTREQPTTNNDSQTVFQCTIPDLVPARNIILTVPLCFVAKGFVDTITADSVTSGTPNNGQYAGVNCLDWYVDNINCGAILNIFENSKLFINGVDILNNFCKTKQGIAMVAKSIRGELDLAKVDMLTGSRYGYAAQSLVPKPMSQLALEAQAQMPRENLFTWLRRTGSVYNFMKTASTTGLLAGTKLEVVSIPLYLVYSFFQQDIVLPPGIIITLELNWPTSGTGWSFAYNKADDNLKLSAARYMPICARPRATLATTQNFEDSRPVSFTDLLEGCVAVTVCNYHPDLSLYFTCNRPRANLHLEYQLMRKAAPLVYNYQLYSMYEMGTFVTGQSNYKFILTPNQQVPQLLHFAWINKRGHIRTYAHTTAWPYDRTAAAFTHANDAWKILIANNPINGHPSFSYTPLRVPMEYIKISKGGYQEVKYSPNEYNKQSALFSRGLVSAGLNGVNQPLLAPNLQLLGCHRLTTSPSERYFQRTQKYEFGSRTMNSRPDIDISTQVPLSQEQMFNFGLTDYITIKLNPASQDVGLYSTDLQAYNISVEVQLDTTSSWFTQMPTLTQETAFVCIREYPAQLTISADGTVTQYTWPNLLISNVGPPTGQSQQAPANNAPGGL